MAYMLLRKRQGAVVAGAIIITIASWNKIDGWQPMTAVCKRIIRLTNFLYYVFLVIAMACRGLQCF